MIKKLLATTLATLSVASMSLPAMAVDGKQSSTQQTTSHSEKEKSKDKNKSMSLPAIPTIPAMADGESTDVKSDSFGFEVIDKEDKDVQFCDEKDSDNGFVEFELNAGQKQTIEDIDKSPGYLAIRSNVQSLKQHISNAYYATSKFNTAKAASEAWNAVKDASYIAGNAACSPVSGGLRYAYDNGLLAKAKDKVVNYVKNDLKNRALGYVGLNNEDSKVAKAFNWGINVFNFFAK